MRRMRKFKPMGSAAQCVGPRPAVEQWGPAGLPVLQDNLCFLLIVQIGYKGLHDSFWVNLGHPFGHLGSCPHRHIGRRWNLRRLTGVAG